MLGRLFFLIASVTFLPESCLLYSDEGKISQSRKDSILRIRDTKTRVSLAAVKLSVGDLKPQNGELVGEYIIEVPLMKSKNDKGKIVLPLNNNIHTIGTAGGILRGLAVSDKKGSSPNLIVCEVIPGRNQKILLEITTDDHTLKFKSNYSILVNNKDS